MLLYSRIPFHPDEFLGASYFVLFYCTPISFGSYRVFLLLLTVGQIPGLDSGKSSGPFSWVPMQKENHMVPLRCISWALLVAVDFFFYSLLGKDAFLLLTFYSSDTLFCFRHLICPSLSVCFLILTETELSDEPFLQHNFFVTLFIFCYRNLLLWMGFFCLFFFPTFLSLEWGVIASGPLAGVTEQPYKHSLNQDFLLLQVILQLHCEAGGCGVPPWPFPACIRVTDDPLERLLLSQLHWCTASLHCFPTCWAVGNFFIVLEL